MDLTSDERERAVLAERARSLARVPLAPPEGEELMVLAFSVGEEAFGVEAAYVREVARLGHITVVPGTPPAVRGVTTHRGEILALVSVPAALGRPSERLTDLLWVVVLGQRAPEFGLLASDVSGVTPTPVRALRPLPGDASADTRRLGRALTEGAALVLDGAALLADQRLFAQRAVE